MEEKTMLSYEEILNATGSGADETVHLDFHGLDLEVRRLIPFELACGIVRQVADACFHPETGEYLPEVKELAMRLAVTAACTNVEIPADQEEQHRLMYLPGLWDAVYAHVEEDQYYDMEYAISSIVDDRRGSNQKGFEAKLGEATRQIEEIAQGLRELFADLTPEDLKGLIAAVGEGGLDEERLVAEVVKQQNAAREAERGADVVPFPAGENDGEQAQKNV